MIRAKVKRLIEDVREIDLALFLGTMATGFIVIGAMIMTLEYISGK